MSCLHWCMCFHQPNMYRKCPLNHDNSRIKNTRLQKEGGGGSQCMYNWIYIGLSMFRSGVTMHLLSTDCTHVEWMIATFSVIIDANTHKESVGRQQPGLLVFDTSLHQTYQHTWHGLLMQECSIWFFLSKPYPRAVILSYTWCRLMPNTRRARVGGGTILPPLCSCLSPPMILEKGLNKTSTFNSKSKAKIF